MGSTASLNTRSWSYPRYPGSPASASEPTETFVWLSVEFHGVGTRLIRIVAGVEDQSRRLSDTLTPTAPSRWPAGSTHRTSIDAGAFVLR